MRIRLLSSSLDDPRETQFLTSFLINGTVAIDAGSAGFHGQPSQQARINHVFLTHSHADHVCSLPMLVTNAHDERSESVVVYGNDHVLRSLRSDVFNGRLWPDLLRLDNPTDGFMQLRHLEPEQAVVADGLRVTPVPVDHVVPTFGYIVEDDTAAVVLCSDTGPTDRIWQVAAGTPNLRAVFLGASFPDELGELAQVAAHLTPRLFAAEIDKLATPAQVIAVHIKPGYRERVTRELEALGMEELQIGIADHDYVF